LCRGCESKEVLRLVLYTTVVVLAVVLAVEGAVAVLAVLAEVQAAG
jgi:hypothetical protein